jgi:hypothetical protein
MHILDEIQNMPFKDRMKLHTEAYSIYFDNNFDK